MISHCLKADLDLFWATKEEIQPVNKMINFCTEKCKNLRYFDRKKGFEYRVLYKSVNIYPHIIYIFVNRI